VEKNKRKGRKVKKVLEEALLMIKRIVGLGPKLNEAEGKLISLNFSLFP
jgi:hypothetical protein